MTAAAVRHRRRLAQMQDALLDLSGGQGRRRARGELDGLKDEARELLDALCDDGGLDQLKKAVAALKRLQAA